MRTADQTAAGHSGQNADNHVDSLVHAYAVPASTGRRYDLQRMRQLMDALGNPQESMRVLHVAGTSGKTSTSYMLRNLLQASGTSVGLTVSPHVESATERLQLDGGPIDTSRFERVATTYLAAVRETGIEATYFELMVGLAFWAFRDAGVRYAVVETGLGGRLDATNIVTRADKICVITDVGLDHCEILGNTVGEIAVQKAGIIQPGNHVLVQHQEQAVLDAVAIRAEQVGATWTAVSEGNSSHDSTGAAQLPAHQQRNRRLAHAAYTHLANDEGLTDLHNLAPAAAITVMPPGRMELLQLDGAMIMLDGAHNPQKLAALRDALRAAGVGAVPVVANLMEGPEAKIDESASVLAEIGSTVISPDFTVSQDQAARRSVNVEAMVAALRRSGNPHGIGVATVGEALKRLLATRAPLVLVTGSLYLVGIVRSSLIADGATSAGGAYPQRAHSSSPFSAAV